MTNKLATPPSSYATLPAGVTMFFRRNENFWSGHIGMSNGRAEMTQPSSYFEWRYHENSYQQFLALPMWERFLKGSEKEHQHSRETLQEFCDSQKEYNKELVVNLRTNFCKINQKVAEGFAAIFPLAAALAKIDPYEVMEIGIGDAPKTDPVTYHDIKYLACSSSINCTAPELVNYTFNGRVYYDDYCNHPLKHTRDYAEKLELLTEFYAAMQDPKDPLHPYVTEMYQGLDGEQRLLSIQALDVLVGCRNLMILGQELMKPGAWQGLNKLIPEVMREPLQQFLANTPVAETAAETAINVSNVKVR
jgi:hypothetical protein